MCESVFQPSFLEMEIRNHSIKTGEIRKKRLVWIVKSSENTSFYKETLASHCDWDFPVPIDFQMVGGLVNSESYFWKATWKYLSWAIKIFHTFWTSNLPSENLSEGSQSEKRKEEYMLIASLLLIPRIWKNRNGKVFKIIVYWIT